ncbi:MAG: LamG domain-containing protein [Candidatus Micrarchaeota archaeon]
MLKKKLRKKFTKSKKRGQTAVEYIATYTWAVALLAIIGGLLYSNGFPEIGVVGLKQASVSGFAVLDFKMDENGNLLLNVGNALHRQIQLTGTVSVNGAPKTLTAYNNSAMTLNRGETGTYLITNALDVNNVNEWFDVKSISIEYLATDTNVVHFAHGFAKGKRESGSINQEPILLFEWKDQTDFSKGNFNSTAWDSNSVTLSALSGQFTSEIRDALAIVNWSNVSWQQQTPFSNGTPLTGSVAADWGFDNGCNLTDSSGNSNTASFQPSCDASKFKPIGPFGNAVCFNGVNESITVQNSASLNVNDITIELWVYHNATSNWYYLAEKGYSNQYRLGLTGSDQVRWLVGGVGEMYSSHTIPKYTWTHIAATYHNNPSYMEDTMQIYINGALDSTFTGYGTRLLTSSPLAMGATIYGDNAFKGCLDEVRIYSKQLNSTEVNNTYKNGAVVSKIQVRSCNDQQCNGEQFTGPDATPNTYYTSPTNLNVPNNQYLQFKILFTTPSLGAKPKLYNVTIKANKIN